MTHTPGPWTLRDDHLGPRVYVETLDAETRIVSFGPRCNWDHVDEGNAHLIEAAPEMLTACEATVAFLNIYFGSIDFRDLQDANELGLKELGRQLRVALFKAKCNLALKRSDEKGER